MSRATRTFEQATNTIPAMERVDGACGISQQGEPLLERQGEQETGK